MSAPSKLQRDVGYVRLLQLKRPVRGGQGLQDIGSKLKQLVVEGPEAGKILISSIAATILDVQCEDIARETIGMVFLWRN